MRPRAERRILKVRKFILINNGDLMAGKDITKKCRACEIDFSKLKEFDQKKNSGYRFPKDIPISKEMQRTVELMTGVKYKR